MKLAGKELKAMPWPGPTRLYDPDVDAGAVMLLGEQARALVTAAVMALEYTGHPPEPIAGHLAAAIHAVAETFGIQLDPEERNDDE